MIDISNAIEIARKASTKSRGFNSIHGCAIFKKDELISTGANIRRRVPKLAKYGYEFCLLHAETTALLKADKEKLKGTTLIVIRVGRTKICNSKPCAACVSMMIEAGVKKVIYSTCTGEMQEMLL